MEKVPEDFTQTTFQEKVGREDDWLDRFYLKLSEWGMKFKCFGHWLQAKS